MNFLITMAPPAAANSPKPPIGVWVGALGKLGWAIINDEKTTTEKITNINFIQLP
ncbi:uncharacterized protein METZ01_LOCUS240079 [marine metagenome]|uniref:Uncharacterized protein n=1 Tax=marine metagenome TaxID=408172 RepID=A0A382HJI6_9ZZZZ